MNGPKMDHFFATKFYSFFSGNPQSNGWSSIFAGSKKLQKVIKITHFDVLQGPFIHRDHASRRASKSLRNDVKMHLKSPQNEHEKTCIPLLQLSKRTPSLDLRKCIKLRFFLLFPVLLCSRHGCKNRSKSSKIIDGGMYCVDGRAPREASQFEVYFTM